MSDRTALVLGLSILAVIAIDVLANDHQGSRFVLRRGIEFIDWLAFWR